MTEPTAEKLMEVKLRIMEKDACKYYPNYSYKLQVCVGSPRKINSAYRVSTHLLSLPTSGTASARGPNGPPLS